MRVIWLSNISICNKISNGSGSWLFAMKELLSTQVELINISEGDSNYLTLDVEKNIEEYLLPSLTKEGKKISILEIRSIVLDIIDKNKPDLIHIWGLEKEWVKIIDKTNVKCPVLLEIQGLRSSLVDVYTSGFDFFEFVTHIGLFELLHPRSLPYIQRNIVAKQAQEEYQVIKKFDHIGCPSKWAMGQIKMVLNDEKRYYLSSIPLRKEF